MRSPVRPIPPDVGRWATRARWLRWLDALAAWLLVWAALALVLRTATPATTAIAAAALVALAALVGPVRHRWRPLGAPVSLAASRTLRPGDRAWLVLPRHVEPVIVTARRRLRLVVARPDQGAEGMEVRRTRVLVVPPAG
jgi:hypothetical protein